jgi:hypothetical protein
VCFSPQILAALPAQPSEAGSIAQLLEASARCLAHQELTHTRACITFLTLLLERTGEGSHANARQGVPLPSAVVEAHGGKLTASCLLGARARAAARCVAAARCANLGPMANDAAAGWRG